MRRLVVMTARGALRAACSTISALHVGRGNDWLVGLLAFLAEVDTRRLSATRYRVELTVSSVTKAKLERIKDLMRHRNPTGDLEKIFDASLDLLLLKLEKERLGMATRPKVKKGTATTDGDPAVEAAAKDGSVAHVGDEEEAAKGEGQ